MEKKDSVGDTVKMTWGCGGRVAILPVCLDVQLEQGGFSPPVMLVRLLCAVIADRTTLASLMDFRVTLSHTAK